MDKTRSNVLTMVYAAMYIALAVALNAFNTAMPIIQMPNGGSLELLVIALFIASYHLGWRWGAAISALSWVIGVLFGLNNYMVSVPQVLLDYVVPFVAIGLGIHRAGYSHRKYKTLKSLYRCLLRHVFKIYFASNIRGLFLVSGRKRGRLMGCLGLFSALQFLVQPGNLHCCDYLSADFG